MPASIAAVSAPAAPAAAGSTAPVQTSAGGDSKVTGDAGKIAGGGAPSPTKTDAPKPAEPPKPQRFKAKAKFDGKDVDLDLDEGEVVREIQKARHHDRTRGDFDKRVQDFEQTLKAITEDPLGFLAKRGVELDALAAEQAQRKAELAKLSPAERRAAELEQQLAEMKSADTKRVEAEKVATAQREHQQLVQTTRNTILEAMKLSGRQRSPELLRLYAEVQELAVHAGEPELSPEQIVAAGERLESRRLGAGIKRAMTDPAWRARNAPLMKELAQAILPALDGQELVDFVGRENAVKLARAQLSIFRKNPIPVVAESNGERQPAPAPARNEDPQAMFAVLDKLSSR